MEREMEIVHKLYIIIHYPCKYMGRSENLNYQFQVQILSISITIFQVPTRKLFLKNLPPRTKNFSFFPYTNLHEKEIRNALHANLPIKKFKHLVLLQQRRKLSNKYKE
jgi:hypothetical protein